MENSNYVGKRLDGRYEIMEVIGVGGMAVVYKAFDNMELRTVAVKILKDEFLANEEFKRRFKNESKAIAVLSHQNIVKVFDVSYGDNLQYIVMEHVDGITLKEYVQQQGKINPREAVYFISQILRALQHAHDKGIVHRDIKPQNIMLQEDGTIKVTDFGIARFSRGETKTMTDSAIGSVHYISPEQAKGNSTDAKTDLYAAGVILYEMLTGSLPFQSDNAVSVALMQLQKEPKMPRELNPDIAIGLEQIIMKAMQKNVADRYQTASEMLYDINRYKENNNIKFNYAFATTGAERAMNHETIVHQEPIPDVPQRPQRPKPPVKPQKKEEPVEEIAEINDKTKKKTIIILSVVLMALIAFSVVLFSIFGPDKKNMLEVPNLEGLNYYQDVVNNPAYDNFKIVANYRSDSTAADGTILEQDPKAEKNVEPGTSINIFIAGTTNGVKIPEDIIGKNISAVEYELKTRGLEVKISKEKNDTLSVGAVIRTEPKAGETVQYGSTVTVYIATNEDAEPIAVPNLIGLTVTEAKLALEKVGLTLNTSASEYRNSTIKAGLIIGYENAGSKVLPGSSIAVYISNGRTGEDTTASTSASETVSSSDTTTTETTTITTTEDITYEDNNYYEEDDTTEPPEEITVTIFIPEEDSGSEEETTYPVEEPEPEPEPEPDVEGDAGAEVANAEQE